MDPSKRKSFTSADEAHRELETAMKQFYQFSESTLTLALKSTCWCEANVKDAFEQAKYCEYSCSRVPHEILRAQLKLQKQSAGFSTSTSGYELSVEFFAEASQKLFLNFVQNPDITPAVLKCVHQEYQSLAGLNKLSLVQEKFQHYLDTNDLLTSFLKTECHPTAAIQVEARIIVEQLKTLSDKYQIKSKLKSMLATGRHKYAKMILFMLVNRSCTFTNEIVEVFRDVFKNPDGTWNASKSATIIFNTDTDTLAQAIEEQVRNSTEPTSSLLGLVWECLNDMTKEAKFVQQDGYNYEWCMGDLGLRFQDFEELVGAFGRAEGVIISLRNLMELRSPHNFSFWDQLLSHI